MMSFLINSNSRIIVMVLLLSLISCKQDSIAIEKVTADKKAVGHWHLVSITSGWTGKTDSPTEKIEMRINEQQQATVYKNDIEVSSYQYTLEETGSETLRYKITQHSGTSPLYLPKEGYFKVSNRQLTMDSTPFDGPAYIFERN
jgi:hypothetical protein